MEFFFSNYIFYLVSSDQSVHITDFFLIQFFDGPGILWTEKPGGQHSRRVGHNLAIKRQMFLESCPFF